jgi:hypothetical protein
MRKKDSDFGIKAEDKPRALELARGLLGQETITDASGRHFSWVNRRSMEGAASIEEMLREWRWEPVLDLDGNITDLYFEGEKLGDDLTLWQAIAPAVVKGSFLEMMGEDGALWRWKFDGTTCEEQSAKVSWE